MTARARFYNPRIFLLPPTRDHHVRAVCRKRFGYGFAYAAIGARDEGNFVVERHMFTSEKTLTEII